MARLLVVVGLVVMWTGCGNSSSNSSLKVSAEQLLGAWRMDFAEAQEQQQHRKFPKTLQAGEYQTSASSLYIFVAKARVNRMDNTGVSSHCDLNRPWTVTDNTVTLQEFMGCPTQAVQITRFDDGNMTLNFAKDTQVYRMVRMSRAELDQLSNQFSLSGAGMPVALRNYLSSSESEGSPTKQTSKFPGFAKTRFMQINEGMYAYTPDDESAGDDEMGEGEIVPAVFLQGGQIRTRDVILDQRMCMVVLEQGRSYVPVGSLGVEIVSEQFIDISGKDKRASVVFQISESSRSESPVREVICTASKGQKDYIYSDFSESVGRYISIEQ